MCNACGNLCCGSDEFEGCGCDGCPVTDCHAACFNCGLDGCDGDCQDEKGEFEDVE